jgi:hypothetical protein
MIETIEPHRDKTLYSFLFGIGPLDNQKDPAESILQMVKVQPTLNSFEPGSDKPTAFASINSSLLGYGGCRAFSCLTVNSQPRRY